VLLLEECEVTEGFTKDLSLRKSKGVEGLKGGGEGGGEGLERSGDGIPTNSEDNQSNENVPKKEIWKKREWRKKEKKSEDEEGEVCVKEVSQSDEELSEDSRLMQTMGLPTYFDRGYTTKRYAAKSNSYAESDCRRKRLDKNGAQANKTNSLKSSAGLCSLDVFQQTTSATYCTDYFVIYSLFAD